MAKAAITKHNIERKINRKRNPVNSIAGLAREFGVNTHYDRFNSRRNSGNAAPGWFRKEVKSLIGERAYNRLRQSNCVNLAYK